MVSQTGQEFERGDSYFPAADSTQEERLDLSYWKAKHEIADTKLLRLEEELDVLLHCVRILRDERTELAQRRLQYPNDSSGAATLENSHQLMDDYLELAKKGMAFEEMIRALKEECAASRSECSYLLTKIRSLSPRQKRPSLFNRKSWEEFVAYGAAGSSGTDSRAVAERIVDVENTATSVSAVIGAFGASVAYTTIFSATRGRLDLVSWAFTCFLLVMASCAAFQLFSLSRYGRITRILRMEYLGSAEHRLFSYVLLVGLPLVTGFLLLAVSVALIDADSQTITPGSQVAIRAAGYLPAAFFGYFVIVMVIFTVMGAVMRILSLHDVLGWPKGHIPLEGRKHYPSLFFALKDKLSFLPGGHGYALYRKQRLNGGKGF